MEACTVYRRACPCGFTLTVQGVDQMRARAVLARHFRELILPVEDGVPRREMLCLQCAEREGHGAAALWGA